MGPPVKPPWTKEEFEQQLRAKGTRYHIHHPFHIAMNSGQCTKAQVQGWVYNRFYYQISIPLKDASILANMPDRDQRRQWILRIIDHDGTRADEGGIEAWLRLADACGQKRALDILQFKLDVLWTMLDTIQLAYGIGPAAG